MKVLIIEDSPEIVEAVALCLQLRWPDVEISVATEGARGVEILKKSPVDIIILDISLPDSDGFSVLHEVRSFSNVPTIILTIHGKEEEQAEGLEMGADDYIVKPFKPRDLVARVNAVIRRTTSAKTCKEKPLIVRGKLTLDLTNNEITIGAKKSKLTPTETRLLYVLMENPEETLSGEKIAYQLWGKEHTDSDELRTYIRRLRNKLEDNPPRIILTDYGEGYKFVTPA
ncbi:MAG: response regulator transcription factor [Chloroflexi bacterium]|nr:response regulator transcription factor [Chloroflexota bacterium]